MTDKQADRQTDGRTHDDSKYRAGIASRGKNTGQCLAKLQQENMVRLFDLNGLAAWRSGNGVGRINEVTLRRARLVLGWVT